ncbi:T-cell surface glycoprotein CD1a [Vulpes lagopus]
MLFLQLVLLAVLLLEGDSEDDPFQGRHICSDKVSPASSPKNSTIINLHHSLKVKVPEAWLSTGPSPRPDHLRLVCHVSGFYPKPVRVTWMRGEQEQQGAQRGDVLPHADGTWYHQVSLDVKVKETAGLSCRVRHSSLRGQDMVLHWEQPPSVGLVFLAVIVLLVFLAGLAWWLWKRCVSSALLPPAPFPPEALPSTCCREIPPLFLPGKHTGDLSALASIWSENPGAHGPKYT